MMKVRSLRRALVPPSLLPNPSPASLQSTRLSLHVNEEGSSSSVFVASGCHAYKVEVAMEDCPVEEGKDSLLIPIPAKIMNSSRVRRCPHRSEVQSLALADACDMGLVLGTVDSYGHAIVSVLDTGSQDIERLTYSALPLDCGVGEGSWAGLCFSPNQWSTVAVARSFCKSIDIYDQEIHLRSLHTLWNPASICFVQTVIGDGGSSIIAIAEGCQLSIWDLRVKQNGGCIQRITGTLGSPFHAVCSSADGSVAVGGADRSVTIFDCRRWSAFSRWVNCSKYEITGLAFSSLDADHIYIQSVDYEVSCGNWKKNNKVFSFRGDSNWLGFSKHSTTDTIAGWCDSGNIFVADVGVQQ
ncbi:uncharacterized protein LOC116264434 isoform X1 [Nymphaea colorata]|nr:uncharacterized protein LOC116264434 isoform X1 [Nymphaea colorata]XP_031500505.1 uncharacterized protein LOC116264434 isoform X1 [Nymphaea colorata]XP_031500506.1 uncharacterized protein LOC116264434 isoform X1 [Nymphaea colorata]XP_049936496.1 uncharacterized protein LOC116264434 isoform X1 [Nymphaea colorata]XP_049936497.1 uncharacterized protein LOC116264434 isoform X1 [Nymphaea colorata]XP_049936498.1 uncharacterized protein LOC116264434 isoform X1 [Nymphaea colorata]XP_049936499.1 un